MEGGNKLLNMNMLTATLKEDARQQTYTNKERITKMRTKLERYDTDPEKSERLSSCLCKMCHYVDTSRIGGQAITKTYCKNCGGEMLFGNTVTDKFCPECAMKMGLCKHCGAKVEDWKKSRKRHEDK